LRDTEAENESARPVDLDIFSDRSVIDALPPVNDGPFAAYSRIDFSRILFAGGCGE
jgi:hypothetical protein